MVQQRNCYLIYQVSQLGVYYNDWSEKSKTTHVLVSNKLKQLEIDTCTLCFIWLYTVTPNYHKTTQQTKQKLMISKRMWMNFIGIFLPYHLGPVQYVLCLFSSSHKSQKFCWVLDKQKWYFVDLYFIFIFFLLDGC